jgi:hypothetical protein
MQNVREPTHVISPDTVLEVPAPAPPVEPQPGEPDVPTPDPKGPETPQED